MKGHSQEKPEMLGIKKAKNRKFDEFRKLDVKPDFSSFFQPERPIATPIKQTIEEVVIDDDDSTPTLERP